MTIPKLIALEKKRQRETLMMIPSENYTYPEVRRAVGSVLMHKYSEGQSHQRYYQGNQIIDQIEDFAIDLSKKLFHVPHANVQPYSGSPANAAIYFALLQPGDKIMGLKLSGGGHLTHGHPKVTFSGKYFDSVQYNVEPDGRIDYDKVARLAKLEKPKIIVAGTTAYPRTLDWEKFAGIAKSVDAFLMADISHIAGLVVAGVHPSPVPYVDVVMTTTHKTLRGPRGAIILVTETGLKKDPDMGKKIDKAVFPGLQGGPHNNTTAGIAIALQKASTNSFKRYGEMVITNAKELASGLIKEGFQLATGGTDNHLMVVDTRPFEVRGKQLAEALDEAGIVTNYNTIPHDPNPPFNPSGLRIGTPAVTTRGMKSKEMKKIASWISLVAKTKGRDKKVLKIIRSKVRSLCRRFPIDLS
jgi:glycine hydroxymethyltransferase